MTPTLNAALLQTFSDELAGTVERAARSIVRVDDGSRLTASGIVWTEEGVIVTTSHGVERDEEIAIVTHEGSRHPAVMVARDPDTDLAVLRIEAAGLSAIPRAGELETRIGSLVLALSRPGASGLRAGLGIVTALIPSEHRGNAEYLLQTDASLYPGASGGALLDMQGRMLGLTNLMFGRMGSVALGTPVVANTVESLLAHGHVRRAYLGVRSQHVNLPENLRASLTIEQNQALLLVQIEPDSPAEKGGLLMGDILLSINKHDIHDAETLRHSLRTSRAGENVTLLLLRGGERKELTVTLGAED